MLARCGRAAHICEANYFFQIGFPAAIAFFKAFKFKQSCIMRIKTVNSSKATGQLQHAGRQKQGVEPLFAGCCRPFSLGEIVLRKTNCVRFGRIASLSASVLFAGGCVFRIAYESFLDYSLLEVFCFQDGEQQIACFF